MEKKTLQDQLSAVKKKCSEQATKLSAAQLKKQDQKEKLSALERSNTGLQDQLSSSQQKLSDLQNKLVAFRKRFVVSRKRLEMETDVKGSREEKEEMEKKLGSLEDERDQLTDDHWSTFMIINLLL